MNFDLLDRYLLEDSVKKADVVAQLLRDRPEAPGAAPFYQGLEALGAKAPDLTLIALRLVLAGKKADDASVVALRDAALRARGRDGAESEAREAYFRQLSNS
jgi:hypothetical protein